MISCGTKRGRGEICECDHHGEQGVGKPVEPENPGGHCLAPKRPTQMSAMASELVVEEEEGQARRGTLPPHSAPFPRGS